MQLITSSNMKKNDLDSPFAKSFNNFRNNAFPRGQLRHVHREELGHSGLRGDVTPRPRSRSHKASREMTRRVRSFGNFSPPPRLMFNWSGHVRAAGDRRVRGRISTRASWILPRRGEFQKEKNRRALIFDLGGARVFGPRPDRRSGKELELSRRRISRDRGVATREDDVRAG